MPSRLPSLFSRSGPLCFGRHIGRRHPQRSFRRWRVAEACDATGGEDGSSAAKQPKMVEAGGVEPPSEKRYEPKPTCLSQFGVRSSREAFRAFARHAQNEQETRPASPMVLARVLRTERLGPAHCVTPLTGPMSKARGSVRLIN